MRKCVFILTIIYGINFLAPAEEKNSIFKKIEFDTKSQLTYKSQSDEYSYSLLFGQKLFLKNFEFKIFEKIPTSTFNESPNFNTPYFGINLLPMQNLKIKAGNLYYSGAISKFNTPTLSTIISPLSNKFLSVTDCVATLPNSSSYKENLSAYIQYSYKNKNSLLKQAQLNFLYIDNNSFIFSGKTKLYNSPKTKFSIATTIGYFPLDSKKIQKIFKTQNTNYENILSSNLQLGISSKYYDGIFSANLYKTNFDDVQFSFLFQNKIKIKNFTLYLFSFYTPHETLITTASKKISTYSQFKLNPQLSLYGNKKNYKLRIGFDILIEEKDEFLTKYGFSTELQTIKTVSKLTFTSSENKFNTNDFFYKAKNKLSISTVINNSLRPYFVSSFEITNQSDSEKIATTTSFGTNFFITKNKLSKFSSSIDFITKKQELSKIQAEIKFLYKINANKTKINLSLGIASNFSFLK